MYGQYKKRLVTYVTKKYAELIEADVKNKDLKESEVLRQIVKEHYDRKNEKERQHTPPKV